METQQLEDPHKTTQFPPYPEEDEINLLDYLIVLLKHKWLIIGLVLIAGVVSAIYALRQPNIYRSEAVIAPRGENKQSGVSSALSALGDLGGFAGGLMGLGGSGSLEKFEAILNSRVFARKIFSRHKYKILPALYKETWDKEKKEWTTNPHPTEQDITKAIKGLLTIDKPRNSGSLKLQVDYTDPFFAKEMVDYYITELSDSLREETIRDAKENKRFLILQLEQTPDVLLKDKIYAMLAGEIERETFAYAQKTYGFEILDPPIVPDLDKRIKPKRSRIVMLSVVVAFFLAVFLSFMFEYVKNLRSNEDPERLEKLKEALKAGFSIRRSS